MIWMQLLNGPGIYAHNDLITGYITLCYYHDYRTIYIILILSITSNIQITTEIEYVLWHSLSGQ